MTRYPRAALLLILTGATCIGAFQLSPSSIAVGSTAVKVVDLNQARTMKNSPLFAASAAAVSLTEEPDYTTGWTPGPEVTFGSSGLKLNIFGFYYGFMAISLGFIWYAALTLCQIQRKLFPNIDKNRRVPNFVSHLWGTVLMHLTRCMPKVEGRENLEELYQPGTKKFKKPVMFVANHCSWMDIPFVAMAMGWLNYKIIAKHELLKVPILSKSLTECGHVMLDRSSRKSQIKTYKDGLGWLKKGVNLCTFAEGTRSVSGRMGEFKGGAFKMAEAVDSPIVPLSIHYSNIINPKEYVFACRSTKSVKGKIIIGKPVYTEGRSDEEVIAEVRQQLIKNLPPSQRPLEE
mmetsp:Transcript_15686/g.24412  ORF Transcript_15686/g.24412 Transcript_15686/m.24412 type:complete len:346 (+) Transcript_15686:136-1173(+)